jgi:GGDEF domain-containing protein
VTIGLAAFPEDADNKDDLIDNADKALYQGKRAGKNCIFLFGAEGKYEPVKDGALS